MQKWVYYDYMGNHNPVCIDAGKITKVMPNIPKVQETYSPVDGIIADGVFFGCDTKKSILCAGGFVGFMPCYDEEKEHQWVEIPKDIKHGDVLAQMPGVTYMYRDGCCCTPICCDPRVLYIMHRAFEFDKDVTAEKFNNMFKTIPTRAQALAYLMQKKLLCDPVPWDAVLKKIQI